MISPLHYRLRAQHGDQEAIEICRKKGWLWNVDDGRWKVLEAQYIRDARGYVPAATPFSPNTPVPGSRAIDPQSGLPRRPYKED